MNAVQMIDWHAILVTWKKIQKTSEWMNVNKKKQQTILKHIKQEIMQEQKNYDIDDK